MKNTFFKSVFLSVVSAVCIVPLTTGCALNTLREINDSAYDISEYQFFDTSDGQFHFGTEPILAFAEGDNAEDYEYSFTTGEPNSLIGIMSVSGLHQTAKGFGEGMLPDYQEMYDNADGNAVEYNGIPAYRITYSESGVDYISIMLQYGNGDLFVLNMTEDSDKNKIEKIAENIIATVEYNGDRLKTNSEDYDSGYFKLTVPPEWYIKAETEEGVTLALNLQDSVSDIGCSYHLKAVPDKNDIRKLANERFSSISETSECTTEVTKAFGNEAFSVEFSQTIMDVEINMCFYYFELNGMCYEQVTSFSANDDGKYQTMVDVINDSVEFK